MNEWIIFLKIVIFELAFKKIIPLCIFASYLEESGQVFFYRKYQGDKDNNISIEICVDWEKRFKAFFFLKESFSIFLYLILKMPFSMYFTFKGFRQKWR